MAKTVFIDTTKPTDTNEPVKFAASRMREIKDGFLQFLGIDHYLGTNANGLYNDESGGNHKLVTIVPVNYSFVSPAGKTDTTMTADDAEDYKGKVYTKVVTIETVDYVELFWMDADGNEIQLTDRGRLADVLAMYFTDATAGADPAGRFRIRANGDAFEIQEKTDDDPETWQSVISWTREGDVTLGNKTSAAFANGVCSVTGDSDAVVWVSGDYFLSSYIGKTIKIGIVDYVIESVEDSTHLTLLTNYVGTTSAEVGFAISTVQRNFKNIATPVALNDAVNKAYLDSYLKYFEVKQTVLTAAKSLILTTEQGGVAGNSVWTAIDDSFYVSITPATASDKVRIQAVINGSTSSGGTAAFLRLERKKTGESVWTAVDDAIGDAAPLGTAKQCTASIGYSNNYLIAPAVIDFIDTPAVTAAVEYRIAWNMPHAGVLVRFNQAHNDSYNNNAYAGRTISTITAQQVK